MNLSHDQLRVFFSQGIMYSQKIETFNLNRGQLFKEFVVVVVVFVPFLFF